MYELVEKYSKARTVWQSTAKRTALRSAELALRSGAGRCGADEPSPDLS